MRERKIPRENTPLVIVTKTQAKETQIITEPMAFIPEYRIEIVTYATTEEGQKESWADIRQAFLESGYASVVTGGLRIFAQKEFTSILDEMTKEGRPTVDLVFHCADMFENPEEGDYRLKENAQEIFFGRLSELYERQQRTEETEHVTQMTQEAVHRGVLRLYVAKERVNWTHSIVLDTNVVFLQRVHRRDDPAIPESWCVKNFSEFWRKYEAKHEAIIRSAVPLR